MGCLRVLLGRDGLYQRRSAPASVDTPEQEHKKKCVLGKFGAALRHPEFGYIDVPCVSWNRSLVLRVPQGQPLRSRDARQ